MRRLLLQILLSALSVTALAAPPRTMQEAEALCDSLPLRGPEGIWEFPDDDVKIMIMRDDEGRDSYSLYIVEAFDVYLHPGDRIGSMTGTVDPNRYRLSLFTQRKGERLKAPRECAATINEDTESMLIESAKLKFSLSSTGLLKGFWRMIRFRFENPLDDLPEGLIRIYPSYDGNGSSRRRPRYL